MINGVGTRRLFAVARSHEIAQIEEMCAAVNRMPDPLHDVLRFAIAGKTKADISALTGLSATRVDQLLLAVSRCIESEARVANVDMPAKAGERGRSA